jgi:uncharacterized protein (TIGR02466 family)
MTDFNLVWATPFLRSQTGSETLAESLREYILGCEVDGFRKPNSPQRPHEGVFESKFDFLDWPDKRVEDFKEMLFTYLGSTVKLVNDYTDEQLNGLQFDNDCWFHISRDGGYFQPHNHPNASWSAIYCVDPGDETPQNDSMAGHVMFSDPRTANNYLDPANRYMRRDMSFNAIRFRLKPAELVVFPSYLYHCVEPYVGQKPRITIAANFWFAPV